MSGEF